MLDRYGNEIEEIPEELPPEIPAPDEEPFGPPDEYMTAHCEFCDDTGLRLNQLGRCDHAEVDGRRPVRPGRYRRVLP